ncbi:MAG TPA: glycosyltransferase family 2 protein [Bacteroidales bacterium]|nr:glycosyltransferase family 2 protein [Bacteroidales bacterium]HRX96482.1 glycosyltransferase family 2 protein [Bacteroidales bacterium]
MKTNDKKLISLILPAYNEEAILEQSLEIITSHLQEYGSEFDWEILIIDDGSKDNTYNLALKCAEKYDNLKVLKHPVNMNLGTSIKTGFANATGDYFITYDLDLSYSPDHIIKIANTLQVTKNDLVIASPYHKNGKVSNVPFLRKVLSRYVNYFMYLIAPRKVRTFTGMVRGFKAEFARSLNLKAMDYEINPEIIYKALILRASMVEIPAHLDWEWQNSFGKKRSSGLRMLRGIFSGLMSGFIFRPYIFFLSVGFITFLLFAYMFVWLTIHIVQSYPIISSTGTYFDDHFSMVVAHVFENWPHLFFVCGFTLIVSFQFISLGFISLQNKRYFEEGFHISSSILKKVREQ